MSSATQAVSKVLKENGLITVENANGLIDIIDLYPPAEISVTKTITSSYLYQEGRLFELTEEFLPLGYLVSSLDIYYNKIDSDYLGTILSDNFSNQKPFNTAKYYLGEKSKEYKMNLDTIFDLSTAQKIGDLNMLFHAVPGRFLSFLTYGIPLTVGEWVKINSDLIGGTTGCLYIVLKAEDKDFMTEVRVFEFDIDSILTAIQETPYSVDSYTEVVLTGTNQIKEVLI